MKEGVLSCIIPECIGKKILWVTIISGMVKCRFRVVCSSPDVCEVGGYKVPFDSYQTLDSERQYSSTVWARGCRALNVGSVIAGTQSNAGKGVISGTSQRERVTVLF